MNEQLKVGDGVRRIGTTDQTNKRTGNVVSLYDGGAQVQWIYESDGRLVRNSHGGFTVKTKVRLKDLQRLILPIDLEEAKGIWNTAIDNGTASPWNRIKAK